MTSKHHVSLALVGRFLRSWVEMVRGRDLPDEFIPWWLDHVALMDSMRETAAGMAWHATSNEDDDWDLLLTAPNGAMAIRCICAAIPLGPGGEKRDVIADAWRALSLTDAPLAGACGVHVVAAMPYVFGAGTDEHVRAAVAKWRTHMPWPGDQHAVWVDPPDPAPRNLAGTAFPGFGLIVRVLATGS